VNTASDVTHRARLSVWALGCATVALLSLAAVVMWAELRVPDRWDPLGDYPVQVVTDGDHSIRVDGLVEVEAVKCAREQVQVRGVLSWQAMDPPGSVIEVGSGTSVREDGCETFRFANPIPTEVRDVIRQQHAAGIAAPVWRITGTETPFGDTREGVPRTWVTENFEVTP
jgi:hypothetical protein